MVLIIAEISVPGFTLSWLGLAVMCVAVASCVIPRPTVSWQLFLWATASIAFIVTWFKFFEPRMSDGTKADILRKAIKAKLTGGNFR